MTIYTSQDAFLSASQLHSYPLLLQEFIPHDYIYKVFLIGRKMHIMRRSFIPIIIPDNAMSKHTFNSQHLPKDDMLIYSSTKDHQSEVHSFDPIIRMIHSIHALSESLQQYMVSFILSLSYVTLN